MEPPFSEQLCQIADSMGIAMYQRFTIAEAALFLRCPVSDLEELINNNSISFIQVTKTEINFFGFQLLEHLLGNVNEAPTPKTQTAHAQSEDRIMRIQEIIEITGVSRSTIWRMERRGEFPSRVPLGASSIGWLKSDIDTWLKTKKE
ncbi:helix-turn-helix transcriptional regulator [Thalassotalea agarivorans]|uniref:Transcriptional regulator, AlpA family n=1 Tax=Thalassotalea agarivorans TaxID=349064 RepID=A0A1I0GL17_THASX|nr:AlpA family transcriptional regulator [Thalassotalea agarivorans]SET71059.1 transcriptional regulator, AlpA family [Thalassotalea agarivorans]